MYSVTRQTEGKLEGIKGEGGGSVGDHIYRAGSRRARQAKWIIVEMRPPLYTRSSMRNAI